MTRTERWSRVEVKLQQNGCVNCVWQQHGEVVVRLMNDLLHNSTANKNDLIKGADLVNITRTVYDRTVTDHVKRITEQLS